MVPAKKNEFRHFFKFRVLSVRPLLTGLKEITTRVENSQCET